MRIALKEIMARSNPIPTIIHIQIIILFFILSRFYYITIYSLLFRKINIFL